MNTKLGDVGCMKQGNFIFYFSKIHEKGELILPFTPGKSQRPSELLVYFVTLTLMLISQLKHCMSLLEPLTTSPQKNSLYNSVGLFSRNKIVFIKKLSM